ncbi:MAG: hypothetical protein SGI77_01020 [Pirellulaceae bacterium]|nr:hypothetical protein [Pirellulaceae bacterium]
MELDKTAIVLKQRSLLDLIDLSLVVLRVYWKPLLGYAAIGVVPFLLLNFFALRLIVDYDSILSYDYMIFEETPLRIRYVLFLAGLVFIQTPVAMLGVTYYLGQALFLKQPTLREFRETVWQVFAGIVLVLGLFRFCAIAPIVVALLPAYGEYSAILELFWLGFVAFGIAVSVRSVRPFAPEILVLEQPPLRAKADLNPAQSITYGTRTKSLHNQLSGDLVGRAMLMSLAIMMTLTAFTLSELFVSGIFFGVWTWEWWMDKILFPLNLWLVALWATVFRFLSYIDCRTRLEGWELDLRLRAEARRLTGALDP